MNKYLFLGKLQAVLEEHLSKDEVLKVMDYYENYLYEALDYGKSEEEVYQELGNPEALAHSIIDNLKDEKDVEVIKKEATDSNNQNSSKEETKSKIESAMDEILNRTIEGVGKTINYAENYWNANGEEITGKINGYINDISSFFEGLYTPSDNNTRTRIGEIGVNGDMPVEKYNEIVFNMRDVNIVGGLQEAESLHIVSEEKAPIVVLSEKNDVLYITTKKRPMYNSKSGRMYFSFPKNYKGKVSFNLKDANVRFVFEKQKYSAKLAFNLRDCNVRLNDGLLGIVDLVAKDSNIKLSQSLAYQCKFDLRDCNFGYSLLQNAYSKRIYITGDDSTVRVNTQKYYISDDGPNMYVSLEIPSLNDSKYVLGLEGKCEDSSISLTGF